MMVQTGSSILTPYQGEILADFCIPDAA